MPINLCRCGRLTGYRRCPWCGGETARQAPPFTLMPAVTPTGPLNVAVLPDPQRGAAGKPSLRAWRKAHREKVALREALRQIDAYRRTQHA